MQKKISALLAFVLSLPLLASGAELSLNEKDTIFIDAVRIQPSLTAKAQRNGTSLALQRAAETLEAEFTAALSATRVFQLVERHELATLAKEQELTDNGLVDPESNAAKAGRLLGAKFVFIPTLDGFADSTTTKSYTASGRSEMTRELFFSAVVRIINTKTGALLPDVPSVQLKKSEVARNLAEDQVDSGGEEFLVTQAKVLARQLAQAAVAMIRPAKVLKVSGKQLLINRGSEAGFHLGDQVEIFAIENIRDEESGETYRNEIPVGQAEITRIDNKQSFAMITGDDLGITAGGIVKIFRAAEGASPSGSDVPPPANETPGSSEKPLKWKD
jgi:curli biogenesis system outer membrane secretion channel CsgG